MKEFISAGGLPEDQRIELIGQKCMKNPGGNVGVIVESDEGKADRYIEKLRDRFPRVVVKRRTEYIDGAELITFQFPLIPPFKAGS